MILIADSSALVALSVCDGLPLLDQLFVEVVKSDKPEAKALDRYLHNKVRKVDMNHLVVRIFCCNWKQ